MSNLEIVARYIGGEPFDGIAIVRTITSRTEVARTPLEDGRAFLEDLPFAGPHVVQACYSDGLVAGAETVTLKEQSVQIAVKAMSEA